MRSILLVLSLTACATSLSERGALVQESDGQDVGGCQFIGTMTGSAAGSGLGGEPAIETAKAKAINKAADKGATHIVWLNISGEAEPAASAKAYRCGK